MMIRRRYFYKTEAIEPGSRIISGVIEVKSFRADPWKALIEARNHAAKYMDADQDLINVTAFNRV